MKQWFKAKRYGWGWYPVTWQGWAMLLIFCVLIAQEVTALNKGFSFMHLFTLTVWIICIISICYQTGEKPRWRWG